MQSPRILPAALQNVDFSGLIRSFDGLFGELDNLFRAFFGDIDVTTVEGLSDALQKIVDVGSTLVARRKALLPPSNRSPMQPVGRSINSLRSIR